jgi:hypothetical protein
LGAGAPSFNALTLCFALPRQHAHKIETYTFSVPLVHAGQATFLQLHYTMSIAVLVRCTYVGELLRSKCVELITVFAMCAIP